jgi:hypothetical protein
VKAWLLAGFLLFGGNSLYGQGCSQCRDNIQQTPARVQAAYRQAITLMAGTALVLFVGVLVVARRVR